VERVRFITHQGKRVLLVDVAHCSTDEAEKAIRTVPGFVTVQPRSSVLLLVDFAGTSFNSETIRAMHGNVVLDKPYIKKSAWIGAESLPDSFRQGLSGYSGRDFPVFKDRVDALEWLTKD
jgi:hypothetical protein